MESALSSMTLAVSITPSKKYVPMILSADCCAFMMRRLCIQRKMMVDFLHIVSDQTFVKIGTFGYFQKIN